MERTLIVEDDWVQLEDLRLAMEEVYPKMEVVPAKNGTEAVMKIKESLETNHYFSLFLLDIQLSDDSSNRDGFTIANYTRKQTCYYKTPILFLTSVKSDSDIKIGLSNFHCYNYITKPYTRAQVIDELRHMEITGILEEKSISITDVDGICYYVRWDDLIMISVKSHVLTLYTALGKIHTRQYTLKTIQAELPGEFVKCHKSYLININHVKNYDKTGRYICVGGENVPVSRNYAAELEKRLDFS